MKKSRRTTRPRSQSHPAGTRLVWAALAAAAMCHSAAAADKPAQAWRYQAELLRPFWLGDTVLGESALFIRDPLTGAESATLMFPVRRVLRVTNAAEDMTYEEGRDYTWQPGSRTITLPAGSRIVSRAPAELRRPAGSQKYQLTHRDGQGEIYFGGLLEYHAMQTSVTYEHDDMLWTGPTPAFDPAALPRTIAALRARRPLSIVLLGDSISSGCNASGWGEGAPFQPPYQELLRRHLAEHYQADVKLTNLSVGGTDTAWGLGMVERVVAERPDLVILAFGMNDSAGRPAKEYQANIRAIHDGIRAELPAAEFILVAPMLGNRDWVRLQHDLFPQYRDALANLCAAGTALADLTGVWTVLLEHKQDWDLTGNGVNHPNDFGHRAYAQVLAALLVPTAM
jgi:lysophospholipase L1-like esterase